MADRDETLTAMARTQMPFADVLGLDIVRGDTSGVEARAAWSADRCTVAGMLHGGYLMSLADSVGAMAAVFHLPQGAGTSTIESKTNFFRPVAEGEIRIVSTPVHVGRTLIAVQTDIYRADGKLVTRTTQTQTVTAPR
jgi:uncharacterized protein (TIGR00369 family)